VLANKDHKLYHSLITGIHNLHTFSSRRQAASSSHDTPALSVRLVVRVIASAISRMVRAKFVSPSSVGLFVSALYGEIARAERPWLCAMRGNACMKLIPRGMSCRRFEDEARGLGVCVVPYWACWALGDAVWLLILRS